MQAIRIGRRGLGRPRTPAGAAMGEAYSSATIRAYLRKRQITAVIPVKEDQKKHRRNRGRAGGRPPAPRPRTVQGAQHRRALLRQAEAVPCRRHRYDKREIIYQGTVDLASIRIWLRDPVQ